MLLPVLFATLPRDPTPGLRSTDRFSFIDCRKHFVLQKSLTLLVPPIFYIQREKWAGILFILGIQRVSIPHYVRGVQKFRCSKFLIASSNRASSEGPSLRCLSLPKVAFAKPDRTTVAFCGLRMVTNFQFGTPFNGTMSSVPGPSSSGTIGMNLE